MMDIVGSIVGLVMFSPLLVTIAMVIRLSSRGPVVFRQERIGLNGKKFMFLKFRTMDVNNDARVHEEFIEKLINGAGDNVVGRAREEHHEIYKIRGDVRATPVGRLLRKTSLDELPQFVNVLKGEMSLVGPRPPIPYEVERYAPWHKRRFLEVKPGMSGLWQVTGRSRTTFNEMVRLDLAYIRNRSLWLDVKILLLTPWAVITGKGAY